MDPTNGHHPPDSRKMLGSVTAADSEKGVTVHLRRGQPVELLRPGQFVVIDGQHVRFFGTISGFRLAGNAIAKGSADLADADAGAYGRPSGSKTGTKARTKVGYCFLNE